MEVKGDFCRQVQHHAAARGREGDYVEIGLDTGVCYNPLHNDLDPYAVAYAIATLLNNLFGKIEGAVLAAGLHRPAEVRDPAAPASRTGIPRSPRCTATSWTTS